MRATFIPVILLFCLSSISHAARFDTSFTFSTIETPHARGLSPGGESQVYLTVYVDL
ncbi:MAG: hypothetical protein WA003_14075 [Desulfuromonadaceae bacterium]